MDTDDRMHLCIAIVMITAITLAVVIGTHEVNGLRKEMTSRGYIEIRFKGSDVWVNPRDIHLFIEGAEQ